MKNTRIEISSLCVELTRQDAVLSVLYMNISIVKIFFTFLKAVDTFSDETKVKLVQEIKDLISKIEAIVQKEKQNISDIDDKKDIYTEKITKMIEEMVNRLKTQKRHTWINWQRFLSMLDRNLKDH